MQVMLEMMSEMMMLEMIPEIMMLEMIPKMMTFYIIQDDRDVCDDDVPWMMMMMLM